MTLECEHGQLIRSCNICEYEREIAELKSEIEAKDREIVGWKAAREYDLSLKRLIFLLGRRNSEITALYSQITCFEKQIARHEEDAESRSKVIAELKVEVEHLLDTRVEGGKVVELVEENVALKAKLSRFTTLMNDNEKAETVIRKGATLDVRLTREAAIDDYRAMLKEEVEG